VVPDADACGGGGGGGGGRARGGEAGRGEGALEVEAAGLRAALALAPAGLYLSAEVRPACARAPSARRLRRARRARGAHRAAARRGAERAARTGRGDAGTGAVALSRGASGRRRARGGARAPPLRAARAAPCGGGGREGRAPGVEAARCFVLRAQVFEPWAADAAARQGGAAARALGLGPGLSKAIARRLALTACLGARPPPQTLALPAAPAAASTLLLPHTPPVRVLVPPLRSRVSAVASALYHA